MEGNWSFGHEVLLKEAPFRPEADVVADTETAVYRLGKVDCQNVLGYEFSRLRERIAAQIAQELLNNEKLAAQKQLEAQRLLLEAQKREEELEAERVAWRADALRSHWLLRGLGRLRKQLASSMYKRTFDAESTVFEQGSVGDCFYLVEEGEVEVWTAGRTKGLSHEVRTLRPVLARTLQKGDSFGELALLYDTKRTATVVVSKSGPAVLQCVSAEALVQALGNDENILRTRFLQTVSCLSELTLWNLAHIVDC